MNWVAHHTMRRARQDMDNEAFFRGVEPASLGDFKAEFAIVSVLGLIGLYLQLSGDTGMFVLLPLLAVNGLLCWQYYQVARFWEDSIANVPDSNR